MFTWLLLPATLYMFFICEIVATRVLEPIVFSLTARPFHTIIFMHAYVRECLLVGVWVSVPVSVSSSVGLHVRFGYAGVLVFTFFGVLAVKRCSKFRSILPI